VPWLEHELTALTLLAAAVVRFSLPSVLYLLLLFVLILGRRHWLFGLQGLALHVALTALVVQAVFQVVLASKAPYGSLLGGQATIIAQQLGGYRLDVAWYTILRLLLPDIVVLVVCYMLRRRAQKRLRRSVIHHGGLRRQNALVRGGADERQKKWRRRQRPAPPTSMASAPSNPQGRFDAAPPSPASFQTAHSAPHAATVERRARSPKGAPITTELEWDASDIHDWEDSEAPSRAAEDSHTTSPRSSDEGPAERAPPKSILRRRPAAPYRSGGGNEMELSDIRFRSRRGGRHTTADFEANAVEQSSLTEERLVVEAHLFPTAAHVSDSTLWMIVFITAALMALTAVLMPSALGFIYLTEAFLLVYWSRQQWAAIQAHKVSSSAFVHRLRILLALHMVLGSIHALCIHLFQVCFLKHDMGCFVFFSTFVFKPHLLSYFSHLLPQLTHHRLLGLPTPSLSSLMPSPSRHHSETCLL
jgi:hypothetical protein